MNPFLMGALAILLRQGILTLIGALGLGPLLQPYIDANLTQFQQATTAAAGFLLIGGYALFRHFRSRQKLMQALAEAFRSEAEIEQMVKSPTTATPSVHTAKAEVPK